ncbi:hypothetical protein BDW42DRAFT_202402 [Aspergillus taichungensis]|uniref:F-box domain-containing protein n=1 Tax=Aspergillus taichungensis TaxID=482145 RepID=A0A2J5I6G2_9EURO|nr:hypothetical protein BDW42DRAFT_202402 [Aspergillus taichungensis]
MAPNLYCPFCGVILLPDPHNLEILPAENRVRPWYAQVRGLYFRNVAVQQIFITGVGLMDTQNLLVTSPHPDVSYVDDEWEPVEQWGVCDPDFRNCLWCFGLHDSCWQLLLLRLSHGQGDGSLDKQAIAKSVFYQLYCTPLHEGSSFQFGHDYLGAGHTHIPFGRPKPIDPASCFYADPCAIPSTDDLETMAAPLGPSYNQYSSPSSEDTKGEGREPPEGRKPNVFERLPTELVHKILIYLSFSDLLKTRLVCRDLAHLSKVDAIPQKYWASRFHLGQEADFFFPNLTDTRNWSLLFFGTRRYLRSEALPLVNRKRIRRLIEPIAVLVESGPAFGNGPYGLAVHRAPGQPRCCQLLVNTTRFFSGKISPIDSDSPLMQLPKPSHVQHRRRLCISMVQIGPRRFVSGINLPMSEECEASDGRLLGYHNPALKRWAEIPPTARLRELEVAFCSEGLRGIKFIFTHSDPLGWFGVNHGPGIAIGILRIPKGTGRYCLLAGLDHLKIVSLAFGELADDHCEGSLELPCTCKQDLSHPHSHLWMPYPPRHENLAISTLLPLHSSPNLEPLHNFLPPQSSLTFKSLVNFDFTGPQGVSLEELTRLAFYMAFRPYPLVGIEASYSNGRSWLFGFRGGFVLSIFVDGPGGERINHIHIFEYRQNSAHPAITLGGLQVSHIFPKDLYTMLIMAQVSTNFGRTATFAPLHIQSTVTTGRILAPPRDHTVTGLTAVWREDYGGFTQIGIQSQPCGEPPPLPSISNHECHLERQDQLQYDVTFSDSFVGPHPGNCRTYASLRNVRRIQASKGIEGRSRSITRITGLKLEYYGHPSPGIVGQWMSPLDDSFELFPDEDIQSLTTWLTPIGTPEEWTVVENGQVVAIHIETTHARSAVFRSPGFHSLPARKLQHQHQSNSGETLTAISWIMNTAFDYVRAVIAANTPARRAQILVPEPTAPFDQICKLDFERISTPDGTANKRHMIATAEAYFNSRTIIGLVFVYTSGSKASIGRLDTTTHKAIHFAPHAHIVGLVARFSWYDLTELAFEVEFDPPTQPRYDALVLSNPQRGGNRYINDRLDVWCNLRDDWLVQRNSRSGFVHDRAFRRPARTRLVGMYFGCQNFGRLGAVYEPEVI